MPEDLPAENEPIFPESGPEDYNMIPYFNINLAWFVMSLPVLTVFPALGGLYYAVMEQRQGNSAGWDTIWEGFKKYWWLSVKWGLLVTAVEAVLAVNIWFYTTLAQNWAIFATTAAIVLLIVWTAINQFSFPLLLMQEEKKIGLAIRNGYVVVIRQPVQALKVLALNLLITAISIILPPLWIFISMALVVQIQTSTMLKAVEQIRAKDADRDAAKAHRESMDPENDEIEGDSEDED